MSPERLAQIREHVRQGRVFVTDARQLLEEVDHLTERLAETDQSHALGYAHGAINGRPDRIQHG